MVNVKYHQRFQLGAKLRLFGIIVLTFLVLQLFAAMAAYVGTNTLKQRIQSAIDQDLADLTQSGDELATHAALITQVELDDAAQLSQFISTESQNRNIQQITVTNAAGIIMADSYDAARVGENLYFSSSEGQAVVDGSSSASIQASSFDNRAVVMTTSRPIVSNGVTIGSLFVNRVVDDNYVATLKSKHSILRPELLSYTKEKGISATTITEQSVQSLILTFFHPTSEWIHAGKNGGYFAIDGHTYVLSNLLFSGPEQPDAGLLVFIPMRLWMDIDAVLSLLVCLTMGILLIKVDQNRQKLKRSLAKPIVVGSALITIACLLVIFHLFIREDIIPIQPSTYEIYNATLRFQPEVNVFDLNEEQTIRLKVDTGSETINTIGVVVNYDPAAISVDQLITDHSICSIFVERIVDNDNGQLTITCGMPSPGFSGQGGIIAELVVHPKQSGMFSLRYQEDSVVLAHDGLGTDVLRKVANGSYLAEDFSSQVDETTQNIIVYSSSHPNPERWYQKNKVKMIWQDIPGQRYVYTFSQNPDAIPDISTANHKATVSAGSDGQYYFKVAAELGDAIGPVATYPVNIDTTAPKRVSIKTSSSEIQAGDAVRLSFSADDDTSGVQKNYYISVNGKIFLPIKPTITMPFPDPGQYTVTVQVFDRADNRARASTTITVK